MKKNLLNCIMIMAALALFTQCGPGAKQMEERNAEKAVTVSDSVASKASEMNDLDINFRAPEGKKFIRTAETKFRVANVRKATETVENMAAEAGGYVTYSYLRNTETDNSRDRISRDSVMISRQVVVENEMILRIPNDNLDTLVRRLNKLVLFLDYRVIKMDDVTYTLLANRKGAERLQAYDQRQKQHIDAEGSKLKEKTGAEEERLQKQEQADDNEISNLMIEDQVKYCNFTLVLYQSPVFVTETIGLVNADAYRPNLFIRIWEAIADGWVIFEYFIIFLFRIWWLFLIGMLVMGGIMVFRKKKNQ
jgi:hypothetical protein